ncbi:HAMP domain-containing sensor histidine kinase [Halorubrum ezzemoulense]|uniref:sensor histidine kinase n=1 Tax=Halorubrum ezzemoulense TaxID=337243 RepID=UPI00232BD100|nr:HAMP domain-containing sensor histidine kinase [Halorubrum ezzemoulense]MDB2271597.1 HAMP domain-containing sensor histidine kinase [Halorubrum ezzemoulense]
MSRPMKRRPGIAYRRPEGDPSRFVIEAGDDPRVHVPERPDGGWLDCVTDEDRDRLREALETDPVDVVYRVASDSEPQWVHERGRATERGDVAGYLFPADERVERRKRLERQRERLEEFASVVSHDLRNPLSVAVGNIELADDLDGDASTEQLDRALDALDRMDHLIGDVLTLAREGKTVQATEPTDLRSVVESAWRTTGRPADAALVVDAPLPTIRSDADRLRQALENLFRNAIEHGTPDEPGSTGTGGDESDPDERGAPRTFASGAGSQADGTPSDPDEAAVRVRVGRTREGFYVADDGPGIDPDQRDAVFDAGHTTAKDGTGFGLAIVERIAEAHGWTVSVTEGREGGARFEFCRVDAIEPAGVSDGGSGPSSSPLSGSGNR